MFSVTSYGRSEPFICVASALYPELIVDIDFAGEQVGSVDVFGHQAGVPLVWHPICPYA